MVIVASAPAPENALVAGFGREAGAPWRKDHKLAAAAALGVFRPRLRSLGS